MDLRLAVEIQYYEDFRVGLLHSYFHFTIFVEQMSLFKYHTFIKRAEVHEKKYL